MSFNKFAVSLMSLAVLSIVSIADDKPATPPQPAPTELKSSHMTLATNPIRVSRTKNTPKRITIEMPVQMVNTVCVHEATHNVWETDPRCGYDLIPQNRWIAPRQVCHHAGPTHSDRDPVVCETTPGYYQSYVENRMRSCPVPENYCAEYGNQLSSEIKKVHLKFKNLPEPSGDQQEIYHLFARQKGADREATEFTLVPESALGDYDVKTFHFFGKHITVKRK